MTSHFPHFIEDKLIHSCNLHISRKRRSKLALTRNLELYEVQNKQILNSIDLQHTILRKLEYKFDCLELEANGTTTQASDIFGNSKTCPNYNTGGIIIGKYIYLKRNEKIVFILVKCWNSMVVVRRDFEGFSLQAEYENVRSFQMTKGNNYQVNVSISHLHDEDDDITNFQDRSESLVAIDLPTAHEYRKMIDRIKIQRSELLVHQSITKKEFAKLKSTELFGCNLLRTPRLEELQILSKCGNSWIKLTANDDVVIGVPLVNNCSSRLTILRNFRAVLQNVGDVVHSFKLYQLNNKFCDMESIQSFFNDSESDDKYSANCSWREQSDLSLRPEAFSVLVLKLKINELFFGCHDLNVPLFLFYDICTSNKTFNQKCFITTISFRDIFSNESCRIKFDEKNLHRDLLTVITSSYETEVRLEYVGTNVAFEDFLCRKLGFYRILGNSNFSEAMNVDELEDDDVDVRLKKKNIFYNKNQDSVWHGTLLEIAHVSDCLSDIRIFTKSEEKSKVFLKLVRFDLKSICGIKDVQTNTRTPSTKLIEFEAALRDECLSCLKTYSNSAMKDDRLDITKMKNLYNLVHRNQFKTDMLFKDLLS